mgnify:CR=1 FL=1
MKTIPALEMKGWRTSASDCTGNQIVVKYEFVSSGTFFRFADKGGVTLTSKMGLFQICWCINPYPMTKKVAIQSCLSLQML